MDGFRRMGTTGGICQCNHKRILPIRKDAAPLFGGSHPCIRLTCFFVMPDGVNTQNVSGGVANPAALHHARPGLRRRAAPSGLAEGYCINNARLQIGRCLLKASKLALTVLAASIVSVHEFPKPLHPPVQPEN